MRTLCYVVFGDCRAEKIETKNVIVQIGAKAGGDGLGDLDCRELYAGLTDGFTRERRSRHAVRGPAVEKRPNLTVSLHSLGKARPAGAFAGPEQRPDQRKIAVGLDEQPWRLIG